MFQFKNRANKLSAINGNGHKQATPECDGQPAEVPCWLSGLPMRKPKVLFIMPLMPSSHGGMQYAGEVGGFKYFNPPLGPMTLAACIYPHEAEIRDENIAPVCYDTDAEIVGITGFLCVAMHIARVIEIAKYFKSIGKLVCIGGPVANLLPEVVRPYCDVLFEGEGELTWPQFMRDYEAGTHKDNYVQVDKIDMSESPIPRIDLINPNDYGIGSVQTARGCPFTCEFCDIIVVYGRKVRTKPIARVIKELELWAKAGMECVILADDNFTSHRTYVKELLKAIIEFNKTIENPLYFFTQASIDLSRDPELLNLLSQANLTFLFIGIESPRKESLAETKKIQNVHTADLEEAIHTIQSHGLFVTGGMIVGFDHDDMDIFDDHYNFLQRAGVVYPMLSVLGAMPKTPLYQKMKEAGRIVTNHGERLTNIEPVCMSYEDLEHNYCEMIQRIHSYDAIKERHMRALSFMRDCKFDNDNKSLRKNLPRMFKITKHYLWTRDKERRKFFFDIWSGTLKTAPRAWKYTWRLLGLYVHNYRHFNDKAHLYSAPATERLLDPSGKPYAVEMVAGGNSLT